MLKKIHTKKRTWILLGIFVFIIVVAAVIITISNSKPDKTTSTPAKETIPKELKEATAKPPAQFAVVDTQVSCKELLPTPTATEKKKYCSGTATLSPKGESKPESYKIDEQTLFYKNGVPISIDGLPALKGTNKYVSIETAQRNNAKTVKYLMYNE